MSSFIETKTFKLKLLSPLHIGGSEKIPFYQLIIFDDKCYVLDEGKLVEELVKRGKEFVDQFTQFASQERQKCPILS